MQRVAIFGNTGGGKSTLAKQLAVATDLPLHSLDKMKYLPGGTEIPHEQYLKSHSELLQQPEWIIDGFGCAPSTWERIAMADTLIYIDLPFYIHGLWVTKRLLKGLFVNPEGWPDNSPIIKSTINSYKVLWLCQQKLTPVYRRRVNEARESKTVYHLTSAKAIKHFIYNLT